MTKVFKELQFVEEWPPKYMCLQIDTLLTDMAKLHS